MNVSEEIKTLMEDSISASALSALDDNRPLTEQGIDSLDLMTLLMSVEERFGVVIPTDRIGSLRSLSDIAGFLGESSSEVLSGSALGDVQK